MRTTLVRDWTIAKDLIFSIRNTSTPKAFIEFQRLAVKFETLDDRKFRLEKFRGRLREFYISGKHRKFFDSVIQRLTAANSRPKPGKPDDQAPHP